MIVTRLEESRRFLYLYVGDVAMEKTVFWPSVHSFAAQEKVARAIVRACGKLEIQDGIECLMPTDSFGNEHSIIDALETVSADDKSNAEIVEGLSKALYIVKHAGFSVYELDEEDQDDAPEVADIPEPKKQTRKKKATESPVPEVKAE